MSIFLSARQLSVPLPAVENVIIAFDNVNIQLFFNFVKRFSPFFKFFFENFSHKLRFLGFFMLKNNIFCCF